MVYPGDPVTFTVELVNQSAEDTPIFVSDPLDSALKFDSATNGAAYDADKHRVTWSGDMPGSWDGMETFEIHATVADTATVGSIDNCAYLYRKLDDDRHSSFCDSIYVEPSAHVTVTKTADTVAGYGEDRLTYNIVMYNDGPLATSNAVLTDAIPSYLTVISGSLGIDKGAGVVDLPEGSWDEETGVLRWEGDLGAGETYTVTFQATVDEDAPEAWAIINAAEFTADNAMWKYNSALTEVLEMNEVYLPLVMRN
jgi:uncharacterized repeat protein (TIGR01451 family)